MNSELAAFILTHKRADNVKTYKSLRNHGYTGKIFLIVDNLDPQIDLYKKNYPNEVIVFDKVAAAEETDSGHNSGDLRAVIFARNQCHRIAENLGYEYFWELDDDYSHFNYRFDGNLKYKCKKVKSLDRCLESMLEFYKSTDFKSIAISQGGDWIGGDKGTYAKSVKTKRKVMNSFLCSVSRPFKFVGSLNDDVNTYITGGHRGDLFLTTFSLCLEQASTQAQSGGLTDIYLDNGTYVKSFYSVMYHPSATIINLMGNSDRRLHHAIKWNNTCPKILRQSHRK